MTENPLPREDDGTPVQGTYTTITDGIKKVTTAGTNVQFTATSTACKRVDVTALSTNTNVVTVGSSTVVGAAATRRGIGLAAGVTWSFPISDLSLLYLDSVTNGEGVSYVYYN